MEVTTFTRGTYEWPEISAEENYTFPCEHGGEEGAEDAVALRVCDPFGIWMEPNISACLTFVTSELLRLRNVSIDYLFQMIICSVECLNCHSSLFRLTSLRRTLTKTQRH